MQRAPIVLAVLAALFAMGTLWIDRDDGGDGMVVGGNDAVAGMAARKDEARSTAKVRGVVDSAEALSADEERVIGDRLARGQEADGRSVIIVTVRQGKDESLERVGWAANAGRPGGPFLLLVDPNTRQVRVEGDLAPEGRAAVAAAMQADLRSGRVASAVGQGLDRLEALAP